MLADILRPTKLRYLVEDRMEMPDHSDTRLREDDLDLYMLGWLILFRPT